MGITSPRNDSAVPSASTHSLFSTTSKHTHARALSPPSKASIKPCFRQTRQRPLAWETLRRRRSVGDHYNPRAYKYPPQAPRGTLYTSSYQPPVHTDHHCKQWCISEISFYPQAVIYHSTAPLPHRLKCIIPTMSHINLHWSFTIMLFLLY